MITEEQITALAQKWTSQCYYSPEEFTRMTREEASTVNAANARVEKRFWKFAEEVAKGEKAW